MKKVYTMMLLMVLIVTTGFAQKTSWQNLPTGFMDNPPIKPVYICLQINDGTPQFDYENDSFDTFWALTDKEYTFPGVVNGRDSEGAGDNDVLMKAAWDDDFLYIGMKVTDDFINDPASGEALLDQFEIYWASYPDYWHAVGDTATTHLDKVVAHTRFPHLGGYKTGDWGLSNGATAVWDDYTAAWSLDPWGPSATPWAVTWGVGAENLLLDSRYEKVDDNNFNFMAIIPWYEAVGDFVPKADTAISVEVKYNDEDPGKDTKCSKSFANLSNDAYWTTYYSGVFNLLAEEDLVAPVLTAVSPLAALSDESVFISFTVSEDAMVYMVPLATTADEASIIAAAGGAKVAAVTGVNQITTHNLLAGDYVLYAIDYSGNMSIVSPTIAVSADVTAPTVSEVSDTVEVRQNASCISDETAMAYLVPEAVYANKDSIIAAAVGSKACAKGAKVNIGTTGLILGSYEIYVIDAVGNISLPGAVEVIDDITIPVLSKVLAQYEDGKDVTFRIKNEAGTVHLVPEAEYADLAAIEAASIGQTTAKKNKNAKIATAVGTLGNYILYAVDLSNNVSVGNVILMVDDMTNPVVVVDSSRVARGADVLVTANEDATVYLVAAGTEAVKDSIVAASVGNVAATEATEAAISSTGLTVGNYQVFAIDGFDNISKGVAVEIVTPVGISESYSKMYGVYPNPVVDMLYLRNSEDIQKIEIANIQGQYIRVINVVNNSHNVSDLESGIYLLRMHVAGKVITQKIIKK